MAKWNVDGSHTTVGFTVKHLMITNVRGEFGSVEGSAEFDPANPAATKIQGSVEVASINTREEKRDAHLRSADFFDADNHPRITFVSREVRAAGDGLEVVGDLTIRGTTKSVTWTVEDVTGEQKDPWGNTRIGAAASTKIKRSEFGVKWNQALEAGGVLVGDEVKLSLEVSLVKQA